VGAAGAIVGPIHLVMGIGASLLTAWILGRPSFTDPRKIVYLLGAVTAGRRPFPASSRSTPTT